MDSSWQCSSVPDKKKIPELKRADFAFMAASIWPRAEWDEYLTLTYLCILFVVWDDVVDIPVKPLSSDFRAAQSFRNEAVDFVKNSLGFGDKGVSPQSRNTIINSFGAIADPVRKVYTRGACRRDTIVIDFNAYTWKWKEHADSLAQTSLHHSCMKYFSHCECPTLSKSILSVKRSRPLASIGPAVWVRARLGRPWQWLSRDKYNEFNRPEMLTLDRYSIKCHLPRSILESPEMKVIWEETNVQSIL